MQDRYAGDIGDFAKLALIRALAGEMRVGIAWYLYPDENHNNDGGHTDYLRQPDRWRVLDPLLFDALAGVVGSGQRTVSALEHAALLPGAVYAGDLLEWPGHAFRARAEWRSRWFEAQLNRLTCCDLVFADPDNGLCETERFRPGRRKDWKRISLDEVTRLCAGRTGIIYHHNTRRAGGHGEEVRHWLAEIGGDTLALRWRSRSPRTFFVVNPTKPVRDRAMQFSDRWAPYFELVER